jgi:hypothetical protein
MTKPIKPNRKHLTAKIKPSLVNLLNSRSVTQGITRSQLIEQAVELYLSAEFDDASQQKSA